MKKLQSNFTTPEQSKRLLEIGMPADSADLLYDNDWLKIDEYDPPTVLHKTHKFTDYDQQAYAPCWSVGRLIEIYLLCAELKKPQMIFIKEGVLMMDRMINELCCMAESEKLDFSKLEE